MRDHHGEDHNDAGDLAARRSKQITWVARRTADTVSAFGGFLSSRFGLTMKNTHEGRTMGD